MNRCFILAAGCLALSGLAGCRASLAPALRPQRAALLAEVYICPAVSAGAVVVDGRGDEPAWQAAKKIPFFVPGTLENPRAATEARMVHDEAFLYVTFLCTDRRLIATLTSRDARLYEEDVVEVFLRGSRWTRSYWEWELSPLGTVLDARVPWLFRRDTRPGSYVWTCEGLKTAVTLDGTLNDPSDRDRGWTAELAIPFAAVGPDGKAPLSGSEWWFNLGRYDCRSARMGDAELSASSPLVGRNFAVVRDWRRVRFE